MTLSELQAQLPKQLLLRLDQLIAPMQTDLADAMRYVMHAGGKRLRPILCIAAATLKQQKSWQTYLDIALAIECLHSYSLVHDDLPAMDDDQFRRGKPTCHVAYDEATAILVGDAFQTLAFELLTLDENFSAAQRVAMVGALAKAAGGTGMVAGQMIDLRAVGQTMTEEDIVAMHTLKTGALIQASLLIGGIAGELSEEELSGLKEFGHHLGLAFQVRDDLLDVTGDAVLMGKATGADARLEKPTYVSLLGVAGAQSKLEQTHQAALNSLNNFQADLLSEIANFTLTRQS